MDIQQSSTSQAFLPQPIKQSPLLPFLQNPQEKALISSSLMIHEEQQQQAHTSQQQLQKQQKQQTPQQHQTSRTSLQPTIQMQNVENRNVQPIALDTIRNQLGHLHLQGSNGSKEQLICQWEESTQLKEKQEHEEQNEQKGHEEHEEHEEKKGHEEQNEQKQQQKELDQHEQKQQQPTSHYQNHQNYQPLNNHPTTANHPITANHHPPFHNSNINHTTTINYYLSSVLQIQEILLNPKYSQSHFLRSILSDFSPFVFQQPAPTSQNQQEQQQNHQHPQSVHSLIQQEQPHQQNPPFTLQDSLFDPQFIMKAREDPELSSLFQSNLIFHCRIAYLLYYLTTKTSAIPKDVRLNLSKEMQELKELLIKDNLRYSFDSFIWTQQRQEKYYLYTSYKKSQDPHPSTPPTLHLSPTLSLHPLFTKLTRFLQALNLFHNPNHLFHRNISHLTSPSYKVKYITEFSFFSFKSTKQVFTYLGDHQSQRFNNVRFYCNERNATYNRLTLPRILSEKKGDYRWLQQSHDYIQWLFPNHYQSNYNGDSFAMGYIQAQIFKTDKRLQQKLVESFLVYLDFMGCRIQVISGSSSNNRGNRINSNSLQQSQKQLTITYIDRKSSISRLQACLIRNTHNHLRIMRILACLSITGLRLYAESFLTFLNQLQSLNIIDFWRIKHPLETMWNLYSCGTVDQKIKALEMCFLPSGEFFVVGNWEEVLRKVVGHDWRQIEKRRERYSESDSDNDINSDDDKSNGKKEIGQKQKESNNLNKRDNNNTNKNFKRSQKQENKSHKIIYKEKST